MCGRERIYVLVLAEEIARLQLSKAVKMFASGMSYRHTEAEWLKSAIHV
jgi:hypothetical protein